MYNEFFEWHNKLFKRISKILLIAENRIVAGTQLNVKESYELCNCCPGWIFNTTISAK